MQENKCDEEEESRRETPLCDEEARVLARADQLLLQLVPVRRVMHDCDA
jgi:hypothetical protein